MTTNLTFEALAERPKMQRGRKAEENPFADAVGKLDATDSSNGLAVSWPIPEGSDLEKQTAKVRRFLALAGKASNVTVNSRFTAIDGSAVRVEFWAVTRVTRPNAGRKPAAKKATASKAK